MPRPHRLCSLDTADGVWILSLNPQATLVRAIVVDRSRPGHVLWRHRARLRPARARALCAHLTWRASDIIVRVEQPRRRVSVRLLLNFDAIEPVQPRVAPLPALLERVATNPILEPEASHPWESLAVFNAAAIEVRDRVHLLYRAIGDNGISVFGYASTHDGVRIEERGREPVYTHGNAHTVEMQNVSNAPSVYQSGMSHVGCEDPRITRIGERFYMTYTAFDGSNPPGVALTSISVRDFLQRKWNWAAPVSLSARGEAHKNWVLFPEKIGGRFALLHGISPVVQIEYFDDLEFRGDEVVQSTYGCSGDPDNWDNRIRGVGAPPIRTDSGWLLLYHAMDQRDPGRYKVGAMLLDLCDPRRLLGRLPHPLLEPDARCENEGCKRGVVYVCGAVQRRDLLVVYYGGADTVVCVATVQMKRLLDQIVSASPYAIPTHR